MKYEYLHNRFNLTDLKKGTHKSEVGCEFCRKRIACKIKISGTENPSVVSLGGIFHHNDGNAQNNSHSNIQILCYDCRKHFQYWGIVQRYLAKVERKLGDLPDCSDVPPVYHPRLQNPRY